MPTGLRSTFGPCATDFGDTMQPTRCVRTSGNPAFGLPRRKRDLVRVGDLDPVHRTEVGFVVGARVGLVALQIEFDGLGVEIGAVVKFDASDEIENQRFRIGEAPGFGKTRLEFQRPRFEIDEGVEHGVKHVEIGAIASGHRIDRARIVRHRDAQRASPPGRCLRRQVLRHDQRASGCGGGLQQVAAINGGYAPRIS